MRLRDITIALGLYALASLVSHHNLFAQDSPLVVRPDPPAREDFETDEDGDGIPDGWYNLRDARWTKSGGIGDSACFRFDGRKPGLAARASRAFGIDGRKYEAVIIGLWVKIDDVGPGHRSGEDPSLVIDFLDESLRIVSRGVIGPWTRSSTVEGRWLHVAKRIAVSPASRDAILSVGLIGATGTLWIDGLSFDLVTIGGESTTNLALNGDVELGEREADHWVMIGGAQRVSSGHRSTASIELAKSGAQAQAAVALPVSKFNELEFTCMAKGTNLRASGGGTGAVFFLDALGAALNGPASAVRLHRFSGSFDWQSFTGRARLPANAVRAVVQFEKLDDAGTLLVDDLVIVVRPNAELGRWTPYHVSLDTSGWHPYEPADAIVPDSALDASVLLKPSLSERGFVTVGEGRLRFEHGGRARFFGAVLLPPLAVVDPSQADALADQLARRGINLVRFDELDLPLGVGRSLLDDTVDDTVTLDQEALARFEHLVAELEKRRIYISLSLIGSRRFRENDLVPGGLKLPPGGGPAAAFDPKIAEVIGRFARALMEHVNPETSRTLKDDPYLAWVTICGEHSLFDMRDPPNVLPTESRDILRRLSEEHSARAGQSVWRAIESAQWRSIANSLRGMGVRAPIAGCSHWRAEPDFVAAQAGLGLDMLDARLYVPPAPFALSTRRAILWDRQGGWSADASSKRRADRPFVASQWCSPTSGLWALPYEGADLLLAAEQAAHDDWDALVRRGVFFQPRVWGAAPPGTQGGDDLFAIAEALNANPAVFAVLPHAASIFLRSGDVFGKSKTPRAPNSGPRGAVWDAATGRLAIDTPYTLAIVVNQDRRAARFENVTIECATPGATVCVSSLNGDPIDQAKRLLVTAVARIEPSGMTYADACRTAPANPGGTPLLCEPVACTITWKRPGLNIKAYALDNSGQRVRPMEMESSQEGSTLVLTGKEAGLHWELVSHPEEPIR